MVLEATGGLVRSFRGSNRGAKEVGGKRRFLGDSPLQHSWFYTDLFFGLQVFFDYLAHLILGYSTCSPPPSARTAGLPAGSGKIRPGTVLPARSREAAVSSYFTGLIFQAPFLNFRPRISRSYPRYGGESFCLPDGFHLSPSPPHTPPRYRIVRFPVFYISRELTSQVWG